MGARNGCTQQAVRHVRNVRMRSNSALQPTQSPCAAAAHFNFHPCGESEAATALTVGLQVQMRSVTARSRDTGSGSGSAAAPVRRSSEQQRRHSEWSATDQRRGRSRCRCRGAVAGRHAKVAVCGCSCSHSAVRCLLSGCGAAGHWPLGVRLPPVGLSVRCGQCSLAGAPLGLHLHAALHCTALPACG